jgi:hypothetical protein
VAPGDSEETALLRLEVEVLKGVRAGRVRLGKLPPKSTEGLSTTRELPPTAAQLACTTFASESN